MNDLKTMIEKAEEMLSENRFEEPAFIDMENYVIKNEYSMKNDKNFIELQNVINEIAHQQGLPTINEQRENFGLNSCAS